MVQRIKGKSIYLMINSIAYTDLTNILLTSAADDTITFADAMAGGSYDWSLTGTCPTDTSSGSFFSMLETQAGATAVPYVYGPNGNSTASATQPHYIGTLSFNGKPDVGGAAAQGVGSAWTYDFTINVDQTPTRSSTT